MVFLYHYTDLAGAYGILCNRRINISTKGTDAFFGEGVYLTGMPSLFGRQRIISNNYDSAARLSKNPRLHQRADYYFRMDSENLKEVSRLPIRRDVWLYPGHITFDKAKWEFEKTPESIVQYHQWYSGPCHGQLPSWVVPRWQGGSSVVSARALLRPCPHILHTRYS